MASRRLPDPQEMKQITVDALKLLLLTETGEQEEFETLFTVYRLDPWRHEFLSRQLVAMARKFSEDSAEKRQVTAAEMLASYVKAFEEGPGMPLSEYL